MAIYNFFTRNNSSDPSKSKPQLEEPESSSAPQNKGSCTLAGSWIPEIGAAVLSMVCIGLLVGFLIYIHDRPYASWGYRVSPNAIISIIVTAAKAAMLILVPACLSQLKWNRYQSPTPLYHMQLFDQASRGAWGSFQILWAMTPGLATMGALLMILSLAIDPFAQQILAFPSRSVLAHNETAYVQSTHEYGQPQEGPFIKSEYPEPLMQASIMGGLAGTHTPLEPKCTSGDCQYPDFVTLGFCSKCQDITSQTIQSCVRDPSIMHVYGRQGYSNVTLYAPANCTYTTPDGTQIIATRSDAYYNYTKYVLGLHDTAILEIKRMKWISLPRGDRLAVGIQQPLVSFHAMRYSDETITYTLDNYTLPEKMPTINICAVYACERQYKNNVYSASGNHLQLYKEQQLEPDLTSNISQARALFPPNQMKQISANVNYSIESATWDKLNYTVTDLFTVNMVLSTLGAIQVSNLLGDIDDIGEMMGSMAASMTDVMRTASKSLRIPGEAFRDETYIHVRWPWIILPTTAVLFSVMLLIATATSSRRLNVVLWKDSVLPLLMFRLQTNSAHDLESPVNVDEVERISKGIKVICGEKGSPLLFSEVKD